MPTVHKPKITLDKDPLNAIRDQMSSVVEFIDKKNEIYRRVCSKITPLVRVLAMETLRRSGLHRITGELEGAIAGTIVYPTSKGIRIGPVRGLKEDTYRKLGALQFGAIRGLPIQNKRTRKKIKAASAGASNVVSAHPLYRFTDSDIRQISDLVNNVLESEMNRFIQHSARKGA